MHGSLTTPLLPKSPEKNTFLHLLIIPRPRRGVALEEPSADLLTEMFDKQLERLERERSGVYPLTWEARWVLNQPVSSNASIMAAR
ncbi:hypothetical protein NDU88_002428 [Pleurodeles waltl]|uniref:Uncharacterized protein n=1 Tax=Pleurodeles waltl TaxID=8319 RepID=A0AAV7M850_PLEWA|nr:hypothetical protein NDU88_002428 [Pleurodeles waltl]